MTRQMRDNFRVTQYFNQGFIYPCHNRPGQIAGSHQRIPIGHFIARQRSRFRNGGGVRQKLAALRQGNGQGAQLAGFNLAESLLFVLVAILLAEQVLAYACSYHPRAREGRA